MRELPGGRGSRGEAERLRLDDQLCFALYAATHAIQRAYRPLLGELGLTYTQYLVLLALWQDGDQTIVELAEQLSLPPHGVGPVVDRLQNAGLVVSARENSDRRVRRVRLTAAGMKLETFAACAQWRVECRVGLDRADLERLRDELRQMVERMRSPDPDSEDDLVEVSAAQLNQGVDA